MTIDDRKVYDFFLALAMQSMEAQGRGDILIAFENDHADQDVLQDKYNEFNVELSKSEVMTNIACMLGLEREYADWTHANKKHLEKLEEQMKTISQLKVIVTKLEDKGGVN